MQIVFLIADNLEQNRPEENAPVQPWIKDFRAATKGISLDQDPDRWPAIDSDTLVTRNPNFWNAYYQVAPGDSGLLAMHAGLLLSSGEATRATHLIAVASQRKGIPKEFRTAFEALLGNAQRVHQQTDAMVKEGIELHDAEKYKQAIKKYDEALAIWPQNGFAHYERGLSLRALQFNLEGEKVPPPDSVFINSGKKNSPPVTAAYTESRRHDPFQLKAYQGDDPEVLRGFQSLLKKGFPAWRKVLAQFPKPVDDQTLEDLGVSCQEAGIHELALTIRQIQVARRGRYAPGDHPFITTSLKKLAPGKPTDEALDRLSKGTLKLLLLVEPEAETP